MSRSYKHTPCISYISYYSNKKSKRIANRKFRKKCKEAVKQGKNLHFKVREIYDVWDFSSEGLPYYCKNIDKKHLRK